MDASVSTQPATRPRRRGGPAWRFRWWHVPAATLAVVSLLLLGIVAMYGPRLAETPARRPAPDFVLRDQNGRDHQLSDYLGRTVVLAGFGDDGAESLATLRALSGNLSELEMHGVKVFGIAALDAKRAAAVHAGEGLRFPLLADAQGRLGTRLALAAQDRGHVSVVVSPTGAIRATVIERDALRHSAEVRALVECCTHEFAPAPSQALGHRLPNFYLPDALSGRPEALFRDSGPRVTVLAFLSSECPCSQSYDGRLARLARELAPRGVRFVGVNANANEPAAEIAAHARRCAFPFPVLLDRRQVVMRRLGARMTPEAYVADAAGTIRYHGRIDDSRSETEVQSHDLREAALAVLRGETPRVADTTPFGCAITPVERDPQEVSARDVRRRFFGSSSPRSEKETR